MMKKLFLTAFAVLAIVSAPAFASPELGKPAPGFTGKDTAGKEVKLSDFAGKTVVLEWTNHECPYVKKHYQSKNMQNTQKLARENDVVWLRIISSAPGKQGHVSGVDADRIVAEEGATATATILDETGEIGKAYGAQTTPHMFVINVDGNLVYAGAIDDAPTTDAESIATAKNYVKTVLDDIKAGRAISIDQSKPYGCGIKYAE